MLGNEREQLWQVYSLLKQIDSQPKHRCCHVRLYADGSGGIFQYGYAEFNELTQSWNNMSEALPILTDYLESLH